jgi:hypothetical protein
MSVLLRDQSPAAFSAAGFEHLATSGGFHLGAKSNGFGATSYIWLKSSFRHSGFIIAAARSIALFLDEKVR